jgi:fucose permease
MVEVKGITTDRAAQFASLFYIGLTVGRFLSGFIMNKLGDRKMIIVAVLSFYCAESFF